MTLAYPSLSAADMVSGSLRLYRQYFRTYRQLWRRKPLSPGRFAWRNRFRKQRAEALFAHLMLAQLLGQSAELDALQAKVEPRLKLIAAAQSQRVFLMVGAYFAYSFVSGLIFPLLMVVLVAVAGDSPWAIALQIGLSLISLPLLLGLMLWLNWRLMVADVAIAFEAELQTVGQALRRSFSLTRHNTLRVMATMLLTQAVTAPLWTLGFVPLLLLMPLLEAQLGSWTSIFGFLPIYFVVMLLVNATLFAPLRSVLKVVIYYDLRVRREGWDLRLGDRPGLTMGAGHPIEQ